MKEGAFGALSFFVFITLQLRYLHYAGRCPREWPKTLFSLLHLPSVFCIISGNYGRATDQRFRVKAIEMKADATLVLNNVFATIMKDVNVIISGETNRPATLTINSNAVLRVTNTQINIKRAYPKRVRPLLCVHPAWA